MAGARMTAGVRRRRGGLILAVIDGLQPAMVRRAIATGGAPTIAALSERGLHVDDCIAAFPSVTPVCAATIATGVGPELHRVPSINWYHRGERRYVEYGSSFQASRAHGIQRSLTDTIYNLNLAHLAHEVPTIFESLDDAGVRTAGTTYLIYRGRFRHPVSSEGGLTRLARAVFPHAVWGPRELFYADIFATRRTGCRSQLGLPGVRDQHAGCVGAYLVEHDLFDFLLLSLPDNDTYSHRTGPEGQLTSIAGADRQLARLAEAAGGLEDLLDRYAVIVMGDHAHSLVERSIALVDAFAPLRVARPADREPGDAELAVSPAARAAMIYVLDPGRRERLLEGLVETALELDGVDLAIRLDAESGEGVVSGAQGTLRFAPAGARSGGQLRVRDERGHAWALHGDLEVLAASLEGDALISEAYPDPLARMWSALRCPTAGDLLLSAEPGWEFVDWGGSAHLRGGSHGSLHADDSLSTLIVSGVKLPSGRSPAGAAATRTAPAAQGRSGWWIHDVAPLIRGYFGLSTGA